MLLLLVQEMNSERSVLDHDMDLLMGVVNAHAVPESLAQRLVAHVYLRHQRCKLTDAESVVPHQLYIDCCERFRLLLSAHHLFSTANSGYINMLVGNMQELILLPGDVLYQVNQPARDMYFVRKGSFVCVRFKNEFDQVGDAVEGYQTGATFGEVGVLIEMLRQDTVLADEQEEQASVCVSLSRAAVEDPLEVYPEQAEILQMERQKVLATLFSRHRAEMEVWIARIFSQRKKVGDGDEVDSPRDGVYDHAGLCIGLAAENLHALLNSLKLVVTFSEAELILAEGDVEYKGYWTEEQARSILLRNPGSGNGTPRHVYRRVSNTGNSGMARFGIRSVASSRKGSKVGSFDSPKRASSDLLGVGPSSSTGPTSSGKSLVRRASASFESRRSSLAGAVSNSGPLSLNSLVSGVSARLGLPKPEESPVRFSAPGETVDEIASVEPLSCSNPRPVSPSGENVATDDSKGNAYRNGVEAEAESDGDGVSTSSTLRQDPSS